MTRNTRRLIVSAQFIVYFAWCLGFIGCGPATSAGTWMNAERAETILSHAWGVKVPPVRVTLVPTDGCSSAGVPGFRNDSSGDCVTGYTEMHADPLEMYLVADAKCSSFSVGGLAHEMWHALGHRHDGLLDWPAGTVDRAMVDRGAAELLASKAPVLTLDVDR